MRIRDSREWTASHWGECSSQDGHEHETRFVHEDKIGTAPERFLFDARKFIFSPISNSFFVAFTQSSSGFLRRPPQSLPKDCPYVFVAIVDAKFSCDDFSNSASRPNIVWPPVRSCTPLQKINKPIVVV